MSTWEWLKLGSVVAIEVTVVLTLGLGLMLLVGCALGRRLKRVRQAEEAMARRGAFDDRLGDRLGPALTPREPYCRKKGDEHGN
jgi:hypothetical protein